MSILIKGMEMPKSCGDCPCLSETYCCCVDGVYPYDCNILIQETEEGSEFIGRLSNCPLVEAPEQKHGKWIYHPGGESEFDSGDFFTCSECNCATWISSDFCPYCGSDMRGKDDV